jgi:hypothetical protein
LINFSKKYFIFFIHPFFFILVRDQDVMAKLSTNMAIRPGSASTLRNMMIFNLYNKTVLDNYMKMKEGVDKDFKYYFA